MGEQKITITPGTIIDGQFKITKLLGKGGMGVVYLALQNSPRRYIALKIINKTFPSALHLKRFLREAQLGARLQHPNIVKTYTFGIYEKMPYVVMEYIGGKDLSQDYHTQLSYREKMIIIQKIANALHYAHKKGIIHRDIKRSNIIISKDNEPIIMDFGLAKSQKIRDKRLTLTGEIVGTPQYMSPEQIQQQKDCDGRSDLYSLGITAYEFLTNSRVYEDKTTVEIMYAAIFQMLPKLRTIDEDIPEEIEAIILKSIEKKKVKRYPSCLEFSQDIDNYLNGNYVEALSDMGSRNLRFFYMKYKKIILASILVIIALILSFCFYKAYTKKEILKTKKGKAEQERKRKEQELRRLKNMGTGETIQYLEQKIQEAKKQRDIEKIVLGFQAKIDFLKKVGYYEKSYEVCIEILEFLRGKLKKNKQKSIQKLFITFHLKLGEYVFVLQNYEDIIQKISLLTENRYTLTIKQKQKCYFYLGIAYLKRALKNINELSYLHLQLKSKNLDKSIFFLKQSLIQVKKIKEEKQAQETLKLKLLAMAYKEYASIFQSSNDHPMPQLLKSDNALTQAIVFETIGIWFYRKAIKENPPSEDLLIKSCKYFNKASELIPWQSRFYYFKTKAYILQSTIPVDKLLQNTIQGYFLTPSKLKILDPILVASISKSIFEEHHDAKSKYLLLLSIAYSKALHVDFCKRKSRMMLLSTLFDLEYSRKELSPKMIDFVIEKILSGVKQVDFIGSLLSYSDYKKIKKLIENKSLSPLKRKKIKSTLHHIEDILLNKQIRMNIVKSILFKKSQHKYNTQKLKEILENDKESIHLRFWAAKTLLASCSEFSYFLLQIKKVYHGKAKVLTFKDQITKVCCLIALKDAKCPVDLYITEREFKVFFEQIEIKKLPQLLQMLIVRYMFPQIVKFQTSYLTMKHDKTLKIMLAKHSLLSKVSENKKNIALETLITEYYDKKTKSHQKAYILWWIFHKNMIQNIPNYYQNKCLHMIYDALKFGTEKVKAIAAHVVGNFVDFENIQFRKNLVINMIKKMVFIKYEKSPLIRYFATISLIRHGYYKIALEKLNEKNEILLNKLAPIIFIIYQDKNKKKERGKFINIAKDLFLKQRFTSQDVELCKFHLFESIGSRRNQRGMEAIMGFVKSFFVNIIVKNLKHESSSMRFQSAKVILRTEFPIHIVLPHLRKQIQKKTQYPDVHKMMAAALVSQLTRLRKKTRQVKKEIETLEREKPFATAYAYYQFFDRHRKDNLESALFNGNDKIGLDLHYLQHINGIFWSLFQMCRSASSSRSIRFSKYKKLTVKLIKRAQSLQLTKLYKIASKAKKRIWSIHTFEPLYRERILGKIRMLEKISFWASILYKCTQLDPNNNRYQFELSYLYFKLGDFKKASLTLKNIVGNQKKPRNLYLFVQALYYYKMKKLRQAMVIMERLIYQKNIIRYEYFGLLGKIYLAQKNWKKAERTFSMQHVSAFFKPEPLIYRAMARSMLGKMQKAYNDYRAARVLIQKVENYKKLRVDISVSIRNMKVKGALAFLKFLYELKKKTPDIEQAKIALKQGITMYYNVQKIRTMHDFWFNAMPFTKKTLKHYGITQNPFYDALPGDVVCFFELDSNDLWESDTIWNRLK